MKNLEKYAALTALAIGMAIVFTKPPTVLAIPLGIIGFALGTYSLVSIMRKGNE